MNPVAESLTGWNNAAAESRPLPEVFCIEDETTGQPAPDPTLRVLCDGTMAGLADHTILIARDGNRIPIDDSVAPIHDDQGNLTGAVLVFRDVTRSEEHTSELQSLRHLVCLL